MGSTAMQGGFGLNGIAGQGAAVPGVASLSAQPMAIAPNLPGFASDPSADPGQQQPQQPNGQYAQIGNALKAVAAANQQRQGQDGGMKQTRPYKPQPISLQQAQAMFDPGRFYGMLRNAGVRGV